MAGMAEQIDTQLFAFDWQGKASIIQHAGKLQPKTKAAALADG
jgi:hypothetical protein